MLTGAQFLAALRGAGYDAFTGVPCSYLTPVLNAILNATQVAEATVAGGGPDGAGDSEAASDIVRYYGASQEGEAVGLAAGMWLTGRTPVVLAQNSGLGNMVNPVTSLLAPLRIPLLCVVTWRGEPGRRDEPQHAVMGEITPALLALLGVPATHVQADASALAEALREARARAEEHGTSSALLLSEGTVAPEPLGPLPSPTRTPGVLHRYASDGPAPTRAEVIAQVVAQAPGHAALVATTGKCARELYTLAEAPRNLYVVGSMGCASAVGLGVALYVRRPVIVLDGDGAALMKLGNLATIGQAAPRNLVHLVLDNGVHDSTGGQPTVGAGLTDFAAIARACGYRTAIGVAARAHLPEALAQAFAADGPTLVHVRVAPGTLAALGRPALRPDVMARRFRAFLHAEPAAPSPRRDVACSAS